MNHTLRNSIFIVDDDPDDRLMIKEAFLESAGEKEYVLIENGDLLLEQLESSSRSSYPALIMLDLNMPGKDGREALREIKRNQSFHHIPTIVFTTSSLDKDREVVYSLGANCFVTKPTSFTKLVDITNSIVKL